MDPLIVLFGFGVGVLVGTTGMGGGSLMTPLLILIFGVKPVLAIGTDLIYGAVTKTVGGWRHFRQGTVDMGISAWLAVGSIPGALVGVVALNRLHRAYGPSFDTTVLVLVAAALLITAVAVLMRALFLPRVVARERETVALETRHKAVAVVTGLVIGFVLSVTSAGSGSLIAIVLIVAYRLTPRRVVGTDVFHAAILLWVAGLAHMASGNVDLGLAANILVGSVPGVWLGTHLSGRLPDSGLRPALGIVLLAAGLSLLSKAGATISPVVIVGVPAVLAVAVWILHLARRQPVPEGAR
jgi:uncharacterized membrane protein YfcA